MEQESEATPLDDGPGVRVRTHPALCQGWGNCHRWAPEVYPLDDEGLIAVHLLEVPAGHALAAWRGAQVCPQQAITVHGPPDTHWIERRRAAAAAATQDRSPS